MAPLPTKVSQLCSPALVYLACSMLAMVLLALQNWGNRNSYHMGSYSCRVPSTIIIFVLKFVSVLFWTWILNLICKDGHPGISWLLVLAPWVLMFLVMLLIMHNM
jgi:hypothetical protein